MGCMSSSHNKISCEKPGPRYFIKNKKAKGQKMIEKVEVFFSLVGTPYQDMSNLKLVLNYSLHQQLNYTKIGETEEIRSGETNYATYFVIDYSFEVHQYLQINLIQNNICLNTITTTLGYVIGSRLNQFDFNVDRLGRDFGIRVSTRRAQSNMNSQRLYFFANVTNVHNLSGDYYLTILNNHTKLNKWKKVFKTKEGRGPYFRLEMDQVNFNDVSMNNADRPFKVQLCKFRAGVVGEVQTTLNSLNSQTIFNIGTFQVELKYEFKTRIKFFDYLQRGLQISFMVGIDYTGSNGVYTSPSSLHYIYGNSPNQYEQAITQCGGIIENYDYDRKFPVYGFGGLLPGQSETSHFFNVNLRDDPEAIRIDGIIHYYKQSLNRIQLSGPTYFAPMIKSVVNNIKANFKNGGNMTNVYYVLLILTDGLILDMAETRNAICKAAKYPFSIIIVGIGNSSDLGSMEELDGDGNLPLRNKKGKKIKRDIVQFVKYNKFKNNPDEFAKQLLCEIPFQVEEYFDIFHSFNPLR